MNWLKKSFGLLLLLITSSSLLITSCNKDDDGGTAITGPSIPVLTSPTDGATDQSLTPILTWEASEALAGVKEYAVFFDTSEDPQTLLSKDDTTTITLSTPLSFLTKYFWKVQVTDNNDQIATSEIFSFTTRVEGGFEIPDAEFGKALEAQGYAAASGDIYVLDETIAASVTTLDLGGSGDVPLDIKNLDGIQFFTSLITLDIDYTSVSDLDLSSNTALDTLQYTNSADSVSNFLTKLDLPSGMKRIRIFRHNLAEFDATQFAELSYLRLDGNDIANAPVDEVTNTLTKLIVNEIMNPALVHLDMGGNLDTDGNAISYEVSQALFAQLTSDATGNKDAIVGAFEGEPGFKVPDIEFGKVLQNLGLATEGEGVYSLDETAAASITSLDLGGSSGAPLNIKDLDGIQFFTSLVALDIDYTSISDLDLSTNTNLDTLQYTNSADNTANFLTTIELPSGMKRIRIFRHNLSDFDATGFTELEYLRLDGNDIVNAPVNEVTNVLATLSVDESINTALIHLDVGGNVDGSGDPITYEVNQALFDQLSSDATGNKDGVEVEAAPLTFTVESVNPSDGVADVATSSQILVTFSSEINESSLVFTLKEGTTDIPHTSSVAGAVLTLTPSTNLSNSAVHTLEITSSEGTNGASIGSAFTSSFTTIAAGAVAVASVEISSELLATGMVTDQIDRVGAIIVTFDTSVETRFDVNSYTLTSGGGTVSASFSASGSTVTITPDASFDGMTSYTLTLLSANPIADNDGSLPSDLVYDFTTVFYIGDGTAGSPFQLSTAEEIDSVRRHLDSNFILSNDVDINSYLTGNGWNPIDDFNGVFDGNSNAIQNIWITSGTSYTGLFGENTGGSISDLGLVIHSTGILGADRTGGMIGELARDGVVSRCYVTGGDVATNVAGSASRTGGFVGYITSGTITESFSTVNVGGTALMGASIADRIGGFVGGIGADLGGITDCYAIGDVSGDADTGGFLGWASGSVDPLLLSSLYSSGNVTATSATTSGIFAGNDLDGDTITSGYFDADASLTGGNAAIIITNLTGVSFSTDGSNSASFPNLSGTVWSFGTTGISGSNGPVLQWEL